MATPHTMRKDSSIKDLFAKPAGKKAEHIEKKCQPAPVTRSFRENLFRKLRDDIAALKQELAAVVKDIRRNMGELEQRIDSLERANDNKDGDLEEHKQEILALRDKMADLNYQLEDLENHLRRCNIRIKGVPFQADAGRLKDYVLHLFRYVAPELVETDILLDRTHRAGRPASSPGQS
ncbi:hypothetical protein NDU88_000933 [Pleurodeles waltl]|uniref:Uncharacterized protein n=1 Tax=Pleurodeles waltl TaxID=8319 RepID=A0AAV7NC07_PLEWA|nr:hypothetical protein NDU88_000933 [Pleurodeles waltl]